MAQPVRPSIAVPPEIEAQIVAAWNEHKPERWAGIKQLTRERCRTIHGMGGPRRVLELLPEALAW